MTRRIDTVGLRSGRLRSVGEEGKLVVAECDCGEVIKLLRGNFLAKYTQSCGCLRNERVAEACTTHGQSDTQLYTIWKATHQRCYNPNRASYKWYGGRGIKVCVRWHDFQNFYDDMQAEYEPGLSIDRKFSDKDYEPGNCRWLTVGDNARRSHA